MPGSKRYICIGVPYFLGKRVEERSAVTVVQASGIAAELGAAWVEVSPDFAAHDDPVVAVNRALAETIEVHADSIPLIFSADCVNALGAVKGLERLDPAVLWYDAHGDFNTPETTQSGFLGGMPLATLVGRGNETLMQQIGPRPLDERDVVITDARDLDPAEGELLRQSSVRHLPHVDALLTAELPAKPLYIHMDTDVVDPAEMPGMSYPAPGGPSLAQTATTLSQVVRDAAVAGVLFALWNNTLEGGEKALDATLALVRAAAPTLKE